MISPVRATHLIQTCRQIAAIFDEVLGDAALDAPAHRAGGVNPWYNRTTSGLYLEFYYGYPSKIWTPGGRWAMTGSTSTPAGVSKDDRVAPFMQRLTTRLYEPAHQSRWGHYGPVYAVLAVDGCSVESPGPVKRFARTADIDYAQEKAQWADLAAGWQVHAQ